MKLPCLLITVFSVTALAHQPPPILVKRISSGTASPAYQYSTECLIYSDRVVTINKADEATNTVEQKLSSSNSLEAYIVDASKGKIATGPNKVGGGGTTWKAFIEVSGETKEVALKSIGDAPLQNNAPAAATLVNLLDLTCR